MRDALGTRTPDSVDVVPSHRWEKFVIITARVTIRQPNSDNAFFFSKGNARNAGIYSWLDTDVLLRGLASIEMKMAC